MVNVCSLLADDGPSPFGYLKDGESYREHLSWSFEMDAVSSEDEDICCVSFILTSACLLFLVLLLPIQ